jgi:protein TonB
VPQDESTGEPGVAGIDAAGSPVRGRSESAGAPPGGGGTGTAGSPPGAAREAAQYLAAHFSYIKELVQKNVSYPGMARKMGWEGKIVIAFTILADGNTRDIRIKESCGIEMLNKSAVEAVKKASPFPRPPGEAQIVLPIVYRLSE